MITYNNGSIFDSKANILVCPVNCVGVMGKGLALEFNREFYTLFSQYYQWCDIPPGASPGGVHVVESWSTLYGDRTIALLATKRHYKNPSQIEWIKDGLLNLCQLAIDHGWPSVAVPALGCGLGGLQWDEVRPIMERCLSALPDGVTVEIYPPKEQG